MLFGWLGLSVRSGKELKFIDRKIAISFVTIIILIIQMKISLARSQKFPSPNATNHTSDKEIKYVVGVSSCLT